ncbi:two-component system, OmpR family, sensor histidine kinase KdpD [Afipia sp. GAS231]|nr:two-component system, OmpR family, sensor histidine kinase KdpD [Afipia sp. GAS231]
MAQRLTNMATKPVGSSDRHDVRLDEEVAAHRIWRTIVAPPLLSILFVSLITAVLLPLDYTVAANLVPVAYLIPVIFAATRWGIWSATLTAIAGMAEADFFFFPPIYSFRVEDPQEAIDLLLFLIVALVSSNLASRLRRETEALRRRENQIQHLYEFSRLLAACFTVSDLISAIQKHLSRTLGRRATFFPAGADGHFDPPESGPVPKAVQVQIASMTAVRGMSAAIVTDEPTQHVWLLEPISSDTAVHGLVAVNIGSGPAKAIDLRTKSSRAVLEEVSLTFHRLDIEQAIEDARLHLQAQLLRDAFHGTLSHELCTPLAAIRGSASVLDSMSAVRENGRILSLVGAISDEAADLDGFIHNLLNATRVTAGGVSPNLEWADPRDIVNAAVKRRARRLAAHSLSIEFTDELPLVRVDSALIEEACGQLLENAAKYSPSGSTISIRARGEQGRAILSISDQGVGITPDEQLQLGRRSFRSPRHQAMIPGSGLGFWIASTFVKANGGAVDISSRGQGLGTTASITLPGTPMTSSELAALSDE